MHNLETKRLLLRQPRIEDAEEMLAVRNSDFVQRFNAMRIIDIERMQKQIAKDIEEKTALYLILKEENKLIGGIWIEDDDSRYEVRSKYLSYYLAELYARKGYMKEALGAVIDMLFGPS